MVPLNEFQMSTNFKDIEDKQSLFYVYLKNYLLYA